MVTKTIQHSNNEILEWRWTSDNELITRPHWTSCYFIDGILIDSGPPQGLIEFLEFIKLLGPNEVELCVLTHSHEDHAGGAHLLKENLNIPIYASKEAVSILKEGYEYPEYRQITWGSKLAPVEAELILSPIYSRSKEYCFDLLPIPGHAPDQIALIEKKKQWAFVSDGLIPKYKRLFGSSSNIQEDISVIYQSINELFKFTDGLDHLMIFLSGREPVFGRKYLVEQMKEIMNLHTKAHDLYKQGHSIQEITQKMFPGEDFFDIITIGELSSQNLIKSLLNWNL